ncbi:hypothetical protein [Agriterribacter sp.]|nr:hypothetical protein [Agriterribacter sp.]HTN08882.1 hypothetical protein [Agriterribacter sp.]
MDTGLERFLAGNYQAKQAIMHYSGSITLKEVKSFLIVMIFYGTLPSQKK